MSLTDGSVRRQLRRIAAVGLFPPWRGTDPAATEAEVRQAWADACKARGLSDADLDAAISAFTAKATSATRWPAPPDVLPDRGSDDEDAPDDEPRGCGRCVAQGYREIAVHHTDKQDRVVVDVFVAYCDCALGEHWRMRRAEPLTSKDARRAPGVRLADAVAYYRNRASTLDVFVDPTGKQRVRPVAARGGPSPVSAAPDVGSLTAGLYKPSRAVRSKGRAK